MFFDVFKLKVHRTEKERHRRYTYIFYDGKVSLTFEIISIFHKLSRKSSICHIDYVFRLENTMTKKKLLLDPDSFLIKFVCRKCIHRFIHTKQLDDLINEIKCSTKIEHTGKCVCSHVLSTLAVKGSG